MDRRELKECDVIKGVERVVPKDVSAHERDFRIHQVLIPKEDS
jgi:hypothetical protein